MNANINNNCQLSSREGGHYSLLPSTVYDYSDSLHIVCLPWMTFAFSVILWAIIYTGSVFWTQYLTCLQSRIDVHDLLSMAVENKNEIPALTIYIYDEGPHYDIVQPTEYFTTVIFGMIHVMTAMIQ